MEASRSAGAAPRETTTPETTDKVISFADHIHGAPRGEPEFLVIRSKVEGHEEKTIRKVVFRDPEATGDDMDAWIRRVLTAELVTMESFATPIKLVYGDGQLVSHEVIKVKGDAQGGSSTTTMDWLICNFKGQQCELTIEYGYNNAEKNCETEGVEVDSHELAYRTDEVESYKPHYQVRSFL